jgi:ABC-type sugar transport system ATPase subunit
MTSMAPPLLELCDISKTFPGVRALRGVRFDLRAGEVHALMGENGAGKSTLVKILCGIYQPDSGAILINGQPIRIQNPVHAGALGISPVHQELHMEPFLSVAENIFLGHQPTGRFGLIDRKRMNLEAAGLLKRLGVAIDPTALVGNISIAHRQIVAIARSISTDAKVVIFDEPTSSLSHHEAELLFAMIHRLRNQGLAIIYISHRMEEIFRLCDRVTVFRDGCHIGTRAVAEMDLPNLITMMIDRDLSDLFRKEEAPLGAPVLTVRNLTKHGVLEDIPLTLRRGEIVGLAGLVGAGRTELARTIFGDLGFDEGEIEVDGRLLRNPTPRTAIAAGIGLVPEDRKDQGLVTGLSLQANIGMPLMPSLSRFGIVDAARERLLAETYIRQLAIRTPAVDQKAVFLSGGNQQRVVIAKWLATRPKVLIVDEPTRGVDVGAKAEIHGLLCSLAKQGLAVLMISSDLPEILAMSDRILVMHQGRLVGATSGKGATQEEIMHYATGNRPQGSDADKWSLVNA